MSQTLHKVKDAIYRIHDAVLLEPESYSKTFKKDLNKISNRLRLHLDKIADRVQYIWSIDEVSRMFAVQSLFDGDEFTQTLRYMKASSSQLAIMRMALNEVTYTKEETPVTHYFGITSRSLEERNANLRTAVTKHQTALDAYLKAGQPKSEEDFIDRAGQTMHVQRAGEQQNSSLDLEIDLAAVRDRWIKPTAIEDEHLTIFPPPSTRTCKHSTSSSSIIEWLASQGPRYHPHDMAPTQPDEGSIKNEYRREAEQEVETKHANRMYQNKKSKSPLRRTREVLQDTAGGRVLDNVIQNLAVHGILGSKKKRKYTRLV